MDETPARPTEPAPSTEALQTIQHRNWTRNIAIAVVSAIVLIGLGWGAGMIANQFATPESEVALAEIQAASDAREQPAETQGGPEGTVYWSESLDRAVLTVKGLPELGDGEEFAVWYFTEETPRQVGAFRTASGAEAGSATVELDAVWQEGDVLQVTTEASAGLSSGAPEGEVLISIDSATGEDEPAEEDTLDG